jgi:hypothetical protein
MAHAALRITGGINETKTYALNEAGLSNCNLIRFVPDGAGALAIQKIGGWDRFFPSSVGSTVRALWAWQDTNSVQYLALGAQSRTAASLTATGDGSTATVTYDGTFSFAAGETVVISGVTPTGFNGAYTVTASSAGSVSYASTETGPQTVAGTVYAGDGLSVIYNGARQALTPTGFTQDVAVDVDTTSGSPTAQITAAGSEINAYDAVYIKTQIAVGGLILFGVYPAGFVDGLNAFTVSAVNALGNSVNATSTVTAGGAVPSFDFVSGSAIVTVTLTAHGYSAGDTFPILVPLTSSGVTLSGNYTILTVPTANTFTIRGNTSASGTATASLNGGLAQYEYFVSPGPVPTGTGFGVGGFGVGGFGVGTAPAASASLAVPISTTDWTLDNWGEVLIACPVGGAIYSWGPTNGQPVASVIESAPPVNDGVFVAMPQRQIVAWGTTETGVQDPLLLRWCDVNNYNSWIESTTNQAGSYRIPKGSKIVGCIQGPQQGLVWTDLSIWAMQYVGPPYVYQFSEIGTGCGLIGRKAGGSKNGVVYWMGQSQFYMLFGEGVQAIPCSVWDVIFQDIDRDNLDKIRFAPNSRFNEVGWFYPTQSSGGEVSQYVKFNTLLNVWDFGDMVRTAWIDQSVLGPPIGAGMGSGSQELIYQHETSTDADGAAMNAYFETGYFAISEGELKIFVDQVWPDMKWGTYGGSQSADLTMTFTVTDYPTATPYTFGPYAINSTKNFFSPRFRGRLVSVTVGSDDTGSFWRLGAIRYRFQGDGKF